MINKQNLKGSCSCGNVQYEITDNPLFTQACHCKDCKKSTGSSFVIHTMIFEDDLVVNGEVSSTELITLAFVSVKSPAILAPLKSLPTLNIPTF